MIQFKVNIKPLSANSAWKGRRIKSDDYKQFERSMHYLTPKGKVDPDKMLRVEIFFGFSNMASDIDNPLKMTIDFCQKKFSFNDKNIFELNVRKCIVSKGQEFIEVGIYPLLPFE